MLQVDRYLVSIGADYECQGLVCTEYTDKLQGTLWRNGVEGFSGLNLQEHIRC